MAAETGAAGTALVKWLGATVILGSLAAVMGFLVLPPKDWPEALKRLFITIMFSAMLGPLTFYMFLAQFPEVLPAAQKVSALAPDHVRDVMKTPFYVIGGWPGWWVTGWAFRWMEKRKNKDLAEVVQEAKDILR